MKDLLNDIAAWLPANLSAIKKSCSADRSETSFKGKGIATDADLNPNPVETARMKASLRW